MSKMGKQAYDEHKADERRKAIADHFRDSDRRAVEAEREQQKQLFVNEASKGVSEPFRVPWLTGDDDKEYRVSSDDTPMTFRPFRAFYDPLRCGWHVVPWGVSFVAVKGVKIGQLACLSGTQELHVRLHVSWLNKDPDRRSDPNLIWKVVRETRHGIPEEDFGWCILDLEKLDEQIEQEAIPDKSPDEMIQEMRERFGK